MKSETAGEVKNTLFIFGSGECGQLPPEYCSDYVQVNPTAVRNLPNDIDQVVCGSMHTIIKTKDDRLFSFGCNDMGVLGRKTHANSTKDPEHSPTLLNFTCKSKIKKISCGDNHTAVLLENGKVYITGGFRDSCGVLGLPSFQKRGEIIPKSEEFVEVKFSYAQGGDSAGGKGVDGKAADGMAADGKGVDGMAADGMASDGYSHEAEKPKQGEVIISNIISGEDHLVCLEQSGEYIYTMGNSDSCQVCNTFYDIELAQEVRNRYVFPNRYHFKDLGFASKFRDIYCGGNNTFVQLEASLDVYAIGRNAYGSCGVSMRDNIIKKFSKIEELSSKEIAQLCGGQSFTVCLLKNNDLYIWGNREILGMESEEDAYSPQELTYFKKKKHVIKTISCGTDHCLVLTESGKLFGWGTGGNDFEEDTCISVIEKNEPSEIAFRNFVTKNFSKGRKDSEISISHLQIVSFAGGSSHCAFITSHVDSERMSIKRGHDEIYEEDENIFIKKHRRENFPQMEIDGVQMKKAHHEEDTLVKNPTNEQGTDLVLVDKPEKLDDKQNKKGSFFKDLFYNPQTPVNSKYYVQSKDLENMDSELLGTVEKTTVSRDSQKRRRSVKSKPYLSNESPTRRQPRRSCKENISLSEKAHRQFYQIVDTPISKKKRKTTTAPSSMRNINVKVRASPSERTNKSRSVGAKRESVGRSYSKRDNLKRESASQTPDAKVVRGKSSKMKS
ncbi:regulator of chromosome condensation [Plasmodium cynomolgi strain B]|uniref:Regulator of chromosome condensation n=1 Tax=Plasmodium cynomolgi (strain B) TaxID=1120755 RepID=K6UPE5_PLACD|nr:regulator of chromosome condensation [Plasmodium cynomolgi strain B]GAB64454.1 regulator of chromosome condensation [Plasmodium cynomolgi strain B]